MRRLQNASGFAILEVLTASSILTISMISIIAFFSFFVKQEHKTVIMSARDLQIASIMDSIRKGAANYQTNFTGTSLSLAGIDISKLPIAWDESTWGAATDFPDLKGRAGFIIEPLKDTNQNPISHLLKVSLRVQHAELGDKIYTFIIAGTE